VFSLSIKLRKRHFSLKLPGTHGELGSKETLFSETRKSVFLSFMSVTKRRFRMKKYDTLPENIPEKKSREKRKSVFFSSR